MDDPVEKKASDLSVEHTDGDLIAACLEGEETAWETLVVRYQRLVYSLPIQFHLTPDDAADIFQCVWSKLWKELSVVRDRVNLRSWLIAATRECWRIQTEHNRRKTDSE